MESYEHVLDEAEPKKKQQYWELAFGLQAVDNLKPSRYMRTLAEKHVEGEKSYAEVTDEIVGYYEQQPGALPEEEADLVSDAIYGILQAGAFSFDIPTLKNYHARLFEKLNHEVYHPGEFRAVNLSKKEAVLGGKSVQYQDYGLLEESLKYDFNEEREQDYLKMSQEEKVTRLSTFFARIWQVHPFYEGNTRTTAVFFEKYLMSLGYEIDNELLGRHAKEFRDALVLANYSNIPEGIQADAMKLRGFVAKMIDN